MLKLLSQLFTRRLSQFRHSLAEIDALPQLTLLGVLIGCCCGLLIVAFRLLIETPLAYFLPDHNENFEGLPILGYLLLPITGAFIIGLAMHFIKPKHRIVSVGHVMERIHNFQGRMHLGNLFVQFFGGILCLITGQSVGREGPAVHIGASAGSLMGQWLRLPNNSLSTLIGCGVAAAISASFNTPIAGVIFAMEVVLMRYSITGFLPIMMASVCGSLVVKSTLGEDQFFSVSSTNINLTEIPFLIIAGLVIALFASLYMRMQLRFNQFSHVGIFKRIMIAGCITGALAILFPEILGLGYDTINLALQGKLAINLLLGIAVAKIVATSISIGLGMPGGLIGPQLLIGACIGGLVGVIGGMLFPEHISNNGIYVLLGMAAMMGAVLNAPMAALTAVVELTYNPSLIFPSMLIIVISCLTTRQLFKCDGIFVEQLKASGTSLETGPIQQILGDIGVRSAMKTSFVESPARISFTEGSQLLLSSPLWIVIYTEQDANSDYILLRASDLATAITVHTENHEAMINNSVDNEPGKQHSMDSNSVSRQETTEELDLLEIPAQRFNLRHIHELASLLEAKKQLDQYEGEALFVTPQIQTTSKQKVLGVITQDTVNNYYI